MSDSMFTSDYLLGGVEVKQETQDAGGMSASVPIPPRRAADLADLRDFTVDLELSQEPPPMYNAIQGFGKYVYDADSLPKSECFKMDDDDIFQVDKADLIQGPTLAELNANPDGLLDDLNFDDLLLPEESSFCLHIGGAMVQSMGRGPAVRLQPALTPQASPATPSHLHVCTNESAPSSPYDVYGRSQAAFSPSSQHSSASSSLVQPSNASNLQELMLRMEGYGGEGALGQSVPVSAVLPSAPPRLKQHGLSQQLSSSAPTHLTMDQIWQRREPRKHLLSTSSIAEAGSVSSLSGGLLSPEPCELSQDEDERDASDEDSDRYEDFSSDESDVNESAESKQARATAKKERYFWQYNVQAKGPKGQRLVLKTKLEDPHVLNSVTDPVFSPSCSVRGIKHSGKARKGDGNDLTPNPRKLYLIGKELDNLGRIINDMIPVSELPFNVRPKTRKEKNKLASRACRLKKKAQHEANKLKLYGLEKEHKRLLSGIDQVKHIITNRVTNQPEAVDWNSHLSNIVGSATEVSIAGRTSEFVNQILDNVKAGQHNGGLTDI